MKTKQRVSIMTAQRGSASKKLLFGLTALSVCAAAAYGAYYYLEMRDKASNKEVRDVLTKSLQRHGHRICVHAPDGAPLPASSRKLERASQVPGLAEALDGPSEDRVAQALRAAHLEGILVSRHFEYRARRPDCVLNRFVKLRFCKRFNAELMAEDWVLYTLERPPAFSRDEKQALLRLARKALSNPKAFDTSFLPSTLKSKKDIETEVILTVWPNHRFKVMARSRRKGPVAAVLKAAKRCRKAWAKKHQSGRAAALADALPGSRIQIDIAYHRGRFVDRNDKVLFHGVELGLAGLYLKRGNRIKVLPPGYAVWFGKEYYTKLLDSLMIVACGRGKTERSSECRQRWDFKDSSVEFGRFASISFREKEPGDGLLELYRAVPLVRMSDIDRNTVLKAVEAGADNMARTVYPGGDLWPHGHRHEKKLKPEPGKVVYRYAPITDYYSKDYNMVRHVLVPYTVMMANRFVPKDLYRKAALASLKFFERHCKWEGDKAFPYWNDNVKTGAAALGAVAIMEYASQADLPGDLEKLAKGLGRFLMFMQDDSGHFRQYYVKPGHPYYGRETTIFPGEILLGLSRLYGRYRDPQLKESFEKGALFYHKYFETAAARKRKDGTYSESDRIDILQFTPWYIMALEDFYRHTKETKYVEWALQTADWAVDNYEVLPPRAPYPDHVGAFWQREREQPAMHGCVYTEGAASALGIATETGNQKARAKFRNATLWGCRFALQLQYRHGENDFFLPFPEKADGAFKYSLTDDHIRIDYTYHALSALTQALKHLDEAEFSIVEPEPDVDVMPAFPEQ